LDKTTTGQILKNIPKNLELVGSVNHSELQNYYKKAKIYCQFSRSESFGVAIVEAMYFGCIPFVTNVGGMPELVGDNGLIVKRIPGIISSQISEVILNYSGLMLEKDTHNWPFSVQQRRKNLETVLNQTVKI
jgi:glycosyltransferase involved in cell wall biosynthesis